MKLKKSEDYMGSKQNERAAEFKVSAVAMI